KQLPIKHVRYRRERMPVVGMDVGKRPSNTRPVKSGLNLWIRTDIRRIIKRDERVSDGLRKDRPRDRDQRGGNRKLENQVGAHNLRGIKMVPTGAQTSCRS